ncbi:MAG: Flp family type IVb pilin [Pirellulales bacterium]
MIRPLQPSIGGANSAAAPGPAVRRQRRGACAIEYCLVISLVAVVLIAGSQHLGVGVVNTFGKLSALLSGDAGDPEADSGDEGDGDEGGGDEQPGGGKGRGKGKGLGKGLGKGNAKGLGAR